MKLWRSLATALCATLLGSALVIAEPLSETSPAAAANLSSCSRVTMFAIQNTATSARLVRYDSTAPAQVPWTGVTPYAENLGWRQMKLLAVDAGTTGNRVLAVKGPGVADAGTMYSYSYTAADSSRYGAPVAVATGWQNYQHLISVGNGIILGIDQEGTLRRFTWSNGKYTGGTAIGNGWNGIHSITSSGPGVLYAVTTGGDLLWYRYSNPTFTSGSWAPRKTVGGGWQTIQIAGAGNGLLYGKAATAGWLKKYNFSDWLQGTTALTADVIGEGYSAHQRIAADPTGCGVTAPSTIRNKIVATASSVNGWTQSQFCSRSDILGLGGCISQWCQDYVWWAWIQAGVPGATKAWFQEHKVLSFNDFAASGKATRRTLAEARPGDAAMYDGHVAIVVSNNNGILTIIHGNWAGGGVSKVYLDSDHYAGNPNYVISPNV